MNDPLFPNPKFLHLPSTEAYPGPLQASKMESFATVVNG